jgi:hypothetical protein
MYELRAASGFGEPHNVTHTPTRKPTPIIELHAMRRIAVVMADKSEYCVPPGASIRAWYDMRVQ